VRLFFNPAHKMPLVEVVVGDRTTDAARDAAVALARRLGKDPVVVRDVPGFVTSRLGLLLGTEAMRMVEEGVASAADIDKAMRLGYGHPLGPLQLADLVGLDARLNNLRSVQERSGSDSYRPPAVLQTLVQQGHLGRKSGRGFYAYDEQGRMVEDGAS
jgi:3-hydroxybutyryl-CoA dehydrogenase